MEATLYRRNSENVRFVRAYLAVIESGKKIGTEQDHDQVRIRTRDCEQRIIAVAGSDFSNTNDGTACFRNKQSP